MQISVGSYCKASQCACILSKMFEIFIPYTGVHLTYIICYIFHLKHIPYLFGTNILLHPIFMVEWAGEGEKGGGNDPMPLKIDGPDTIATVSQL